MKLSTADTIALWNTIGVWVAGLATTAAVIVSLWLARQPSKVKLDASVGMRVIFGGRIEKERVVAFSVTNLSDRPVTITGISWVIGWKKDKQYALQNLSTESVKYPNVLGHGQVSTYYVSLVEVPDWGIKFSRGFVRDISEKHLSTLRAVVHTSVNQNVSIKPDEDLLKYLRESWAESAPLDLKSSTD